jgi:Recombination endonuclease VII
VKRCGSCKLELPEADFTLDSRSKDRLKPDCKNCRSNYMKIRRSRNPDKLRVQSREWARNNPNKVLDSHYRAKYNISLDEFNKMCHDQGGKCSLCDKIPKGKLVVDHDHVTSKIRGLLCRSCNGALGVLGDNVSKISKVIQYLEKK